MSRDDAFYKLLTVVEQAGAEPENLNALHLLFEGKEPYDANGDLVEKD
jgi:hypothetical protein